MNRSLLIFTFLLVLQQTYGWIYWHHREQLRPVFVISKFFEHDEEAPSFDHPYQALIILDDSVICSGALVTDEIVVTAAQCLAGAKKVDVELGVKQLLSGDSSLAGIRIQDTDDIKIHENFDFFDSQLQPDYDIALIYLGISVSESGISPIRLPRLIDADFNYVTRYVDASGWGKIDASQNSNLESVRRNLATSTLVVISNEECTAFYGQIINDRHLCAKAVAINSCYGELGSPLANAEIEGAEKIYTLIGIASFGSWAGCEAQAPQVFTRIGSFLPWLLSNGVPIDP